ncbi:diguanylate cyclase [bacterium]|nr:MAG: diguanylate cyclase [bacterium]
MNQTSPQLSPALQEQLKNLREGYAAKLPEKLTQIESLWQIVGNEARDQWPDDALFTLHRLVHSLAGSGATFGFPELSLHARRAEVELKNFAASENEGEMDAAQRELIATALADLRTFALYDESVGNVEMDEAKAVPTERGELVLLTDDPDTISWASAIETFGYKLNVCISPRAFLSAMQESPAALIVNCESNPLEARIDGVPLSSLLATSRAGENFPIIWTARQGDLRTRLQAVRLGGAAFFPHPVDVDSLLVKLDDLTSPQSPEPFRVLVVDDEPSLARLFGLVLRQAGMEAREVTEPLDIMNHLVEFRPDIILMDVYMPGCKGTELASVIRQQEAYLGIPIVFLSVESDIAKQQEAMKQGGDDFLSKPVEPRNLVGAISTRAARARVLRQLMVRDSLTGLLNHTNLKEQLEIEVSRAMRLNQNLALAMLDLDHFKSVNDTYGHATGDRVLRSLARMLTQRLRATDVVGRYGGEEFAVILTGANAEAAAKRLEEVREAFACLSHFANGQEFKVTFSCGVSGAPPNGESAGISEAADKALYEAKRAGRNCIVVG